MKIKYLITFSVCFLLSFKSFSQGYADEVTAYRKNNLIKIGKLKITNATSSAITIFLYHPDAPTNVSFQIEVEIGDSFYPNVNGNPLIIGTDWGYEVSLRGQGAYGGENVNFIGNDVTFNEEFDLKIGVAYGNWWEAPNSNSPDESIADYSDYYDYYDEETCDYHDVAFSNNSGVEIKLWVYYVPEGKTAYELWVYRPKNGDSGVIGHTNMDFYWYAEEPEAHSDGRYQQWKGTKHVEASGEDYYMREEKLTGRKCDETVTIIW